jgi:hypothetical protein
MAWGGCFLIGLRTGCYAQLAVIQESMFIDFFYFNILYILINFLSNTSRSSRTLITKYLEIDPQRSSTHIDTHRHTYTHIHTHTHTYTLYAKSHLIDPVQASPGIPG